ncbi:MAG: glutamate racemase [Sporomusaceae bacterium]|nr:glutamate racemase [Sporomusaceae bacterium]
MKIGVFDSGIGGLTVLYRALNLLPKEDYVYFADTLHVPYGEKSTEEVRELVFSAIDFIAKQGVKAIVLACNSATSAAAKELRERYDFPIIGIEPAVKPAILQSVPCSKRVMVFATALTLREEKYHHLVENLDECHMVDGLPMPGLVEFAERFEFRPEVVAPYVREQLAPYDLSQYGALVLGCTHFPLFRDIIASVLPPDVAILDGGIGTAENLARTLQATGKVGDGSGKIEYYHSKVKVEEADVLTRYDQLLKRLKAMEAE